LLSIPANVGPFQAQASSRTIQRQMFAIKDPWVRKIVL